ncbi:MAG: multidrug transporter, partial [Herminiimonas sp.]|nr:multidrug transporter [Herminiimonas sp.]
MTDAVAKTRHWQHRLAVPALTVIAAAVLGACSMTPQFVRPAAPVADTFPASAPAKAGER